MSIAYRPEIDGLRAIAVAAVVLYHAGLGGTGFVGVDVFFVISGYLITALLLRERDQGGIGLLAFYARRVRRIVPAATFVVLATLAASSLLLSRDDLAQVANSAGAAAIFGANFFFQLTTGGYWDASAEQMPLLHLWSLSVEEQFYLLWPALLMFVPRQKLLPALIGLAVLSLVAAEVWVRIDPHAAFYQTPLRFWELAAGGIIAALPARALPKWAAWAGIATVAAACAWTPPHFPGLGALPAVTGSALIIAAVHGGARNALLASRPFVGLGLISYSLYLWHWPLLALYRATSIGEGSQSVRLQLCAVAVLLAVATYRYIEQPFRRMPAPPLRLVGIGASLSACLALAACGWGYQLARVEYVDDGDKVLAIVAETGGFNRPIRCRYGPWKYELPLSGCATNGPATVATWGDSTAMSWGPLAWELAHPGGSATTLAFDACPPLQLPQPDYPQCADFNRRALPYARGIDTLILSAQWGRYRSLDVRAGLRATLEGVASVRRIIIVGPTPEMPDKVPKCIRAGVACSISRGEFDATAAATLALLREEAARWPNVEVLDPTEVFCDAVVCPGVRDGVALYIDDFHPSTAAVTQVATTWLSPQRSPEPPFAVTVSDP